MLSSSDTDLVARDPTLPGLATLLDTAAFTEGLRGWKPAFAQATVQPTYARYKHGTRCLVAYDVRVSGSRVRVHASAYPPSRWAERVAACHAAGVDLSSTSPILVHDRFLVVRVFPEDARLRVLKRLWDPVTRRPLLRKLLPECHALHSAAIETLAYNPERRYVALLRAEETLAVIKLYADGVFGRARAAVSSQRLSRCCPLLAASAARGATAPSCWNGSRASASPSFSRPAGWKASTWSGSAALSRNCIGTFG
jgi:hypothetical protein